VGRVATVDILLGSLGGRMPTSLEQLAAKDEEDQMSSSMFCCIPRQKDRRSRIRTAICLFIFLADFSSDSQGPGAREGC
jgi:hypothetical protein